MSVSMVREAMPNLSCTAVARWCMVRFWEMWYLFGWVQQKRCTMVDPFYDCFSCYFLQFPFFFYFFSFVMEKDGKTSFNAETNDFDQRTA